MKEQGADIAAAPLASGLVLASKPVIAVLDLTIIVPALARAVTEDNAHKIVWCISHI